jgi:hypothetical protein
MNRIQVACWLTVTLHLGCSGKLVVDESQGAAGTDGTAASFAGGSESTGGNGGSEGEPACMSIVSRGYPCEQEGRECAMTVVDCSGADSQAIYGVYRCTDGAWVLISEPTEVEVDAADWCDNEFGESVATGGTGGAAGAGAGGSSPVAPPGCEGTITFADPVVDAAVRMSLPGDVENITHEDIWLFDTLDLEGGVSDLSGVECLTGLTFVKIQHAEITDLGPLSGLELLTFLGLSYNQITDLEPLRGLETLQKLYVEGNPISDLGPLAGLTALTHLAAGRSQVSDLSPLENLTALEWVYMYAAEVTDLTPLVDNPGIGSDDEVNVNGNPIDCEAQAANIQELEDREVRLVHPCD